MIKICFLFDTLICGGAAQALFDLVRLMDKTRFDITVFTLNNGEWDQKFRDAGIRVVDSYAGLKAASDPLGKLRNLTRRLRIEHCRRRRGKGLLRAALPAERFDIVASYTVWRLVFAGLPKNSVTVKYIHGDVGTDPETRRTVLQAGDHLGLFDRIFCVSQRATEHFNALSEFRAELHYNPIDSRRILEMAGQSCPVADGLPYLCAVGRLAPEKGYVRLIRIHRRLLDMGAEHRLVIVGDGPEREAVENAIRETGTEGSVILAGYQANPYPYMKNSHCLVCSSFTEALPVISMEALSLGVPIVSSAPSIGEVFGGEPCGIITESDDDSLLAGIHKMLTDRPFYQTAKAGAENRSAFFDGTRMVKEVEDIFLELVK